MTQPPTLTPELEAELSPAEVKAVQLAHKPDGWALRYPKPEQADIEEMFARTKPLFDQYRTLVEDNRKVRYLQDEMPEKWRKRLQGSRRFRSRLGHNETLRVAAMVTRNQPQILVPQSGTLGKDEKRGDKQTRWSQNFFKAVERRSSRPILRRVADAMVGDGMGVLEFYLTENSIYETRDTEPQDTNDPKTGERRQETADETVARLDAQLQGAPIPFGLRYVDPLAVLFDEDEDGICAVLIVEQKPYRQVFNRLKSKDKDGKLDLPKPGTYGWPVTSGRGSSTNQDGSANWFSDSLSGGEQSNAQQSVLTMRYYDRRWYGYIVGGVAVEGFTEHNLPGVPVFTCWGVTTGSPNLHEMMQGVTWGMSDQELYINDLMTMSLDVAYALSRPRPVIETDGDSRAQTRGKDSKPLTLNLDPDAPAPFLEAGQHIVDAFANFRGYDTSKLIAEARSFWQMNGLNPIEQGQSPGADVAGYTVNSLSQAAQNQYEILLQNYARFLANIVDFARLTVRDTIREKVYLSVPMQDSKKGGTEWLALGPEDVDETPSEVEIDPLSDVNRMQKVQQLSQLNKEGMVRRERVQTAAGVEDPEAEDDALIIDAAEQDMAASVREAAKAIVYGKLQDLLAQQQGQTQPGMAPPGMPQPGGAPLPPGAAPAPPQPPTVGGQAQAASSGPGVTQPGPAAMPAATALAGTARP